MKKKKSTVTRAKKTPKKTTTAKKTKTTKAAKATKVVKKPKATKKTTAKHKMSPFQEYVLLAAVINQLREIDNDFRLLPLPDVNSSLLAPLREQFAHFSFTANEVPKAVDHLIKSKDFKSTFPVKHAITLKLQCIDTKETPLMMSLLLLAGLEANKTIYLADKDPHDIQKTTLEKFALKTEQISSHLTHHEQKAKQEDPLANKKILIKLNYNRLGRNLPTNLQILSAKHRRGRG